MLAQIREGITPVFDKRITLGNVIEIIVLLVAIVTAYNRLQNTQATLELQLSMQRMQMDEIKTSYVRADVHNIQIEAINKKLDEISSDVKDVKKAVK